MSISRIYCVNPQGELMMRGTSAVLIHGYQEVFMYGQLMALPIMSRKGGAK